MREGFIWPERKAATRRGTAVDTTGADRTAGTALAGRATATSTPLPWFRSNASAHTGADGSPVISVDEHAVM